MYLYIVGHNRVMVVNRGNVKWYWKLFGDWEGGDTLVSGHQMCTSKGTLTTTRMGPNKTEFHSWGALGACPNARAEISSPASQWLGLGLTTMGQARHGPGWK